MASKRILQQELDDYTKQLGQYDAQADFYNRHAKAAQAGTQSYFVPVKPIEEQKADWERRRNPEGLPEETIAGLEEAGLREKPEPFRPTYNATNGSDADGNILVQHGKKRVFTWAPDPNDSYVKDGLTYLLVPQARVWVPQAGEWVPQAGEYRPVFPDRPTEPKGLKAPSLTRSDIGKLATPDMTPAMAEKEAGRSAIQRAGVGSWSPFADSNNGEGILLRALKGKL